MADALRLLEVHVEVADQHYAALSPDRVLAAGKLAGRHVALHDIDTVLRVEGDTGDFIETNDVVLADEPALAAGHVHEHAGHGRLAAGNKVRVGRDLLKEMALASAAWPKFDEIVVSLNERNHAQQCHPLSSLVELSGLEAYRAK